MSGFTTDLLTGLAVYLAAGGLGATWNATGAYTVLQTGIVLGNIPQSPDRVITITAYAVADSPNLSDSTVGVQIRTRWDGQDKRGVDDLDDSIFNLLHGKCDLTLSTGVVVGQCYRQSASTLGQDESNRWGNVSNYYCSVHRPSTNRT
jgi:Bacteriophage minor capsid protein